MRAVVFTGSGTKAFCVGGDLKEREGMTDEVWRAQHLIFEAGAARVLHCPVPVIAAVEGFAMGGGCELAVLSDFIVARESAVFAVPEVTLGIFPGIGGTQLLPAHHRRAAREGDDLHRPARGGARGEGDRPRESPRAGGPGAREGARDRGDHRREWSRRGAPGEEGHQLGQRDRSRDGMALAIEAYNNTVTTEDRLEGVQSLQREAQAALQGEMT